MLTVNKMHLRLVVHVWNRQESSSVLRRFYVYWIYTVSMHWLANNLSNYVLFTHTSPALVSCPIPNQSYLLFLIWLQINNLCQARAKCQCTWIAGLTISYFGYIISRCVSLWLAIDLFMVATKNDNCGIKSRRFKATRSHWVFFFIPAAPWADFSGLASLLSDSAMHYILVSENKNVAVLWGIILSLYIRRQLYINPLYIEYRRVPCCC